MDTNPPDTMIPGAFANMSVDGVTFDGSADTTAATSIVTFNFGVFGPVGVHTAATECINSGFTPVYRRSYRQHPGA